MQPILVSGYPTYKHKSSKTSIWFSTLTAEWIIGWTNDIGSNIAGIRGPKFKDDWPQNLSGWRFYDHDINDGCDAGSDVVIEGYSDGKLETHTNYA